MNYPLDKLAKVLNGQLNDKGKNPEISGIAPLLEAKPGEISFFSDGVGKQKHLEELKQTKASALIASEKAVDLPLPTICFKNAYVGLARALELFRPEYRPKPGIHPTAFVDESAEVHPTAIIGAHAVVEAGSIISEEARIDSGAVVERGASVGKRSRLCSNVTLRFGCTIGEDSIIHSGTVIGSDGFGFTPTSEGHLKIPQTGNVEIGNKVEIGANVTIDRATMGKTIVNDGTKVDNLVHLAHNVSIGKNCLIIAQVGISGSTTIEDNVTLAGQAGTVGHITIGKDSIVAARGVATEDLPPGSIVSGFPCKPHSEEKKIMIALRRLPELIKKVRELENKIDQKVEK
ncbi:MAG: UDP-3-O-(3-hydroxymyristoyl)glucosamine N-acyltransferase [Candidatus Riflebacteria bacterium]|nr:UDP-3-O-(3-hydroxymyristoyl)glucosamine N-acyltransferase [Candidatus Riflebacteria bacterium]